VEVVGGRLRVGWRVHLAKTLAPEYVGDSFRWVHGCLLPALRFVARCSLRFFVLRFTVFRLEESLAAFFKNLDEWLRASISGVSLSSRIPLPHLREFPLDKIAYRYLALLRWVIEVLRVRVQDYALETEALLGRFQLPNT
jgi:hypothetical protein